MEYRTVKSYPNYKVREDGLVIGARGKELKYDYNRTGYPRISLCKDGVVKRIFIHRLVALHFLEDAPSDEAILNHKDGDKLNNHYSNLEWTTHADNLRHALDTGLRDMKNSREMSEDQKKRLYYYLTTAWPTLSYQRIADIVGISYNAVALVNRRLRERATTIPSGSTPEAIAGGSAQPS